MPHTHRCQPWWHLLRGINPCRPRRSVTLNEPSGGVRYQTLHSSKYDCGYRSRWCCSVCSWGGVYRGWLAVMKMGWRFRKEESCCCDEDQFTLIALWMNLFNAIPAAAVVASFFVLASPVEALWGGNKKPSPSKYGSIDLNEAISDRKDNPLRFRSKYKQKKVMLSGIIDSIGFSRILLVIEKKIPEAVLQPLTATWRMALKKLPLL